MKSTQKLEQGFSLVEMAIVMVIIGLIVAAVTVGKSSMQSAETMKAYQKVVVPCVSMVSEAIRNGNGPADKASLEEKAAASIPSIKLGGKTLSCEFFARPQNKGPQINHVNIVNANDALIALANKTMDNTAEIVVRKDNVANRLRIRLYYPGGPDLPTGGIWE